MIKTQRSVTTAAGLAVASAIAIVVGTGIASATPLSINGKMEGNLAISPGDTLRAGYDFTIPGGPATDDTVSVTGGTVVINATCGDGTVEPLTLTLPDQSYAVPRKNSQWFPSGDQKSALVYQASLTVPATFCGGQQGRAPGGATFSADFTASEPTSLNVRFHYVNNTSGSWSGTAKVGPSTLPSGPPDNN